MLKKLGEDAGTIALILSIVAIIIGLKSNNFVVISLGSYSFIKLVKNICDFVDKKAMADYNLHEAKSYYIKKQADTKADLLAKAYSDNKISDEDISKELPFWQPIKNPTVMFRKERFGEQDSPYDHCADYWFWSKHYDRHFHLIPQFMVNYRRHESQMTTDKSIFREETAKIIQRNMAMFGKDLDLDTCKKLDRYSKTYDEGLKKKIQREIFR